MRRNAAQKGGGKKKPRKEPADAQECEPQPSKKAATVRSETVIGPEGISYLGSASSDPGRRINCGMIVNRENVYNLQSSCVTVASTS